MSLKRRRINESIRRMLVDERLSMFLSLSLGDGKLVMNDSEWLSKLGVDAVWAKNKPYTDAVAIDFKSPTGYVPHNFDGPYHLNLSIRSEDGGVTAPFTPDFAADQFVVQYFQDENRAAAHARVNAKDLVRVVRENLDVLIEPGSVEWRYREVGKSIWLAIRDIPTFCQAFGVDDFHTVSYYMPANPFQLTEAEVERGDQLAFRWN